MKLLVTGGAGFIGSHVVDRLVADGHDVAVLDDLSTGSLANLAGAADAYEFFEGDIADPALVASALKGRDGVIHLAAVASVEASVLDPLRCNKTNLVGTITVLEAAAKAGVSRFVYASSAAVYGEADSVPIDEDSTMRPRSPYAADKLAGEHYLAHFRRRSGLNGTAFRFFNVYGPRQDPSSPYSGVISIFLAAVAAGRKVTIHGDGSQTRDFVYVADVVEAITRALGNDEPADTTDSGATDAGPTGARPASSRSAGGELAPLNLGRGVSTDLNELLAAVASACGRSGQVEIQHAPPRDGDIAHSLADISRLRARFGWSPSTTLLEGLQMTVENLDR